MYKLFTHNCCKVLKIYVIFYNSSLSPIFKQMQRFKPDSYKYDKTLINIIVTGNVH